MVDVMANMAAVTYLVILIVSFIRAAHVKLDLTCSNLNGN